MIVSMIVAMGEDGCIGKDGRIPWRLSADLKRFKRVTMGRHLIMGRKTFESLGRPLPGRVNIVITRSKDYQVQGCLVANSLQDALAVAEGNGESEVFVIGGGEIYAQALPLAGRLYLTKVHTKRDGDVFFPAYNLDDWEEIERDFHAADEYNEYPVTFTVLARSTA